MKGVHHELFRGNDPKGKGRSIHSIIAEKRELDKSYRALGQWYACEYGAGEVPEAVADIMAAVRASQDRIAELQASREAAESAESTAPEEGAVCPVCGKITNTKFCPHCGAPMERALPAVPSAG